jgi:hypothetical protein
MKIFLILLTPLISACSIFGVNDTEQLVYETLLSDKDKEIRLYDSFVKAQVQLTGNVSENRDDSFKILAGYIFGKNNKKSKISMTSPVVTKAISEKIKMTSPVVIKQDKDQSQMYFKMPSKYTIDSLPQPDDDRVKISKEPKRIYAVITYSGSWNQDRFEDKKKELMDWIKGIGSYKVVAVAKYAGYNPPWTLPWFRKNEVLLEIAK